MSDVEYEDDFSPEDDSPNDSSSSPTSSRALPATTQKASLAHPRASAESNPKPIPQSSLSEKPSDLRKVSPSFSCVEYIKT